jgi:CPA2 family monovalent cation:H+ antiporter-2
MVLAGFGRVGSVVGQGFRKRGTPFVVIEDDERRVAELAADGIEHVVGSAVLPEVLEAANVAAAKALILAIPNGFEAGHAVIRAKALNPAIRIVARAHSVAEVEHLRQLGADRVIMGEEEIAHGMLDYAADPQVRTASDGVEQQVADAAMKAAADPG